MQRKYPCLFVNTSYLHQNAAQIVSRCRKAGIDVCGVIKGCSGMSTIARLMLDCGVKELGTSRLEQAEGCRADGISAPFLLLRIPAMSELPDVVRLCETSLQSDLSTLYALERECAKQEAAHRVIVMADLGDLREGFWDKEEMVDACCRVERDMPHLILRGIGVNLGCYGAIRPTVEKMNELLAIARRVEDAIGRKLETVSGGATSSFPLVNDGVMPKGINHLRIGEAILIAKDLQVDWGLSSLSYLHMNAFRIRAEIIEIREKASCPQGEQVIDAFGNHPTFTDIGNRRRALVALGRADVGTLETLRCCEDGVLVLGGSSDHCILDITDAREMHVGDTIDFFCNYSHMLYASSRSDIAAVLTESEERTN